MGYLEIGPKGKLRTYGGRSQPSLNDPGMMTAHSRGALVIL